MSTRCQIQIIGPLLRANPAPGDYDTILLFRHMDGYPDGTGAGTLERIAQAFALPLGIPQHARPDAEGLRGIDKWHLNRAYKSASYLCATDAGNTEPLPYFALHGDIAYFYRVYVTGGFGSRYPMPNEQAWYVEVFETRDFDGLEDIRRVPFGVVPEGMERIGVYRISESAPQPLRALAA